MWPDLPDRSQASYFLTGGHASLNLMLLCREHQCAKQGQRIYFPHILRQELPYPLVPGSSCRLG